jgi:hypothetical protein
VIVPRGLIGRQAAAKQRNAVNGGDSAGFMRIFLCD